MASCARRPCRPRLPERRLSWRVVGILLVAPVLLLSLNSGKSLERVCPLAARGSGSKGPRPRTFTFLTFGSLFHY